MATTDMDFNQTEIFLSSQVKKKDGGFTEDQSKVFMKFWRNNRNKIHESLVKKCMWNNSLKHLSWRIDVKSRARDLDEISTPTAIVELQIENTQLDKDVEVKRFEMDESSLSRMLSSLKDIEEQIEKHSK